MGRRAFLGFVRPLILCASLSAQSASAALLVLPEANGHRLVLIDPRAKAFMGQISVPGWPHEVAFSDDGRLAYVPSYSDGIVGMPGLDGQTIDVVDMPTRTVSPTWDLGKPLRPHKVMLAENGTLLVTTELTHSLSIVDRKDVGEYRPAQRSRTPLCAPPIDARSTRRT